MYNNFHIKNGYLIVSVCLVIGLMTQYLLRYVYGDFFLYLDDILVVIVAPFFLMQLLYNENYLRISVIYLVLKGLVLFVFGFRLIPALSDLFFWYLKPLILFWGGMYVFERLSKMQLRKLGHIVSSVFIITVIYGVVQFVLWYLFKIEAPMKSDKYFAASGLLMGDKYSLVRVSSIYGQSLWFGYVSLIMAVYYMINARMILYAVSVLGVIISFSRWALFLLLLITFLYFFVRVSSLKKIFLFVALFIASFYLLTEYFEVYSYLYSDYNYEAIKIIGIRQALELIVDNPIGYGFATFGTMNSLPSDAMSVSGWIYGETINKKSGIEALLFIMLVQIGVDGVIMYNMPFVKKFFLFQKSLWFYLVLILFPLVTFYMSVFIVLVSFVITYINNSEYDN